jgi:uncharacterized membrane protein
MESGGDKKLFILMLVVIITTVVESQIGYIADFIPEQLSSSGGVTMFIIFAVIFAITQYLILMYIKHLNKEMKQRIPHLHILHVGVSIAQYVLVGVVASVVLQILVGAAIPHHNSLHHLRYKLRALDCGIGSFGHCFCVLVQIF